MVTIFNFYSPLAILSSIKNICSTFGSALMSFAKVMFVSRRTQFNDLRKSSHGNLIILGNGPSLRENIDNDLELLKQSDCMAVNFAANTSEFFAIKPRYYVLADPHFFQNTTDSNVKMLSENLQQVDWPMTLFVPVQSLKIVKERLAPSIIVKDFNMVAVEGPGWFRNLLFKMRLGMPRPRNVLIPSLMIGIWMGYQKIYILGADHSWLRTLTVDDNNKVVSVQPHFYKENPKEIERITKVYDARKLHEILESMTIAFRSYHTIRDFADCRNISITNCTPHSYIDAFARGKLRKN